MLKVLLAVFVLLVVQSTLVPFIAVAGITPDLLLVLMVHWCYQKKRSRGVVLGFFGGLLQDLSGTGMVGVLALCKSVACYATGSVPAGRYGKNPWVLGVVLLGVTIVHHAIYYGFAFREIGTDVVVLFFRYGVPAAFYTAFVGVAVYAFLDWWGGRRGRA